MRRSRASSFACAVACALLAGVMAGCGDDDDGDRSARAGEETPSPVTRGQLAGRLHDTQGQVEEGKARLPDAENRNAELAREIERVGAELDRLREENARLGKEAERNASIIRRLTEMGVPVNDLLQNDPLQAGEDSGPPIECKVIAVRAEVNLVMLSVGSEDGVKRGMRFTVYRDEKYIGKVEVEKVFADMSSARILRDWTKEKIRENDDAATRVFGKPTDGQPDGKRPAAEDGAAGEDAPAEGPREVF